MKPAIRSIGKLFSASIIAQVIQFSGLFYLASLYDSTDFALYTQVNSIVTVLSVIACLQLHIAVVSDRDEKVEILSAGFLFSSIFCLFSLLMMLIFERTIAENSKNIGLDVIVGFWILLQFTVLSNFIKAEMSSEQAYKSISHYIIFRAFLCASIQILFSNLDYANGLVLGIAFSELIVFFIFRNKSLLNNIKFIDILKFKASFFLIKKKINHTLYGTLQELVGVAAFLIPLITLPFAFGNDVAGQFAMAHRILWGACVALSMAISQVCLYKFSLVRMSKVPKYIFENFRIPILFVLVFVPVLFLYVDDLFLVLLGAKWALASEISKYLIIWCSTFILSVPFRVCYKVYNLQKQHLCFESILIFIYAGTVFYASNIIEAVMFLCVVGFIHNVLLIFNLILVARLQREV